MSIDGAAAVAYLVHTRYPSSREGLWMATLPE